MTRHIRELVLAFLAVTLAFAPFWFFAVLVAIQGAKP